MILGLGGAGMDLRGIVLAHVQARKAGWKNGKDLLTSLGAFARIGDVVEL